MTESIRRYGAFMKTPLLDADRKQTTQLSKHMPAGHTVRPAKWRNVIDLYDDGEYSAIWGIYENASSRCRSETNHPTIKAYASGTHSQTSQMEKRYRPLR